jgi:hypothetical protein
MRLSQWGKDKNIKPNEMKAIVRKKQQRKLVETDKGGLNFRLRGNLVESEKIDRWMKRNGIPEEMEYAPSLAACKRACNILLSIIPSTNIVSYTYGTQCLDSIRARFFGFEPWHFNAFSNFCCDESNLIAWPECRHAFSCSIVVQRFSAQEQFVSG